MPEEFITYRSTDNKILATEMYQRLVQEGFAAEWESSEGHFDPTFANNEILNLYYIKLRKCDFAKADDVLMKMISENAIEPAADYYLFSFTEAELLDVLKKPDEWNEYDRYWAKEILQRSGNKVELHLIEREKIEYLDQLKKPLILNKLWLLGPLCLFLWAMLIDGFLPSLGIVFVGVYVLFSKRTFPDGERAFAFSDQDRMLARITIVVGLLLTLLVILLVLMGHVPMGSSFRY